MNKMFSIIIVLIILSVNAGAQLYTNAVQSHYDPDGGFAGYERWVSISATAVGEAGSTTFFYDISESLSLQPLDYNLGYPFAWYVLDDGDAVDFSLALSRDTLVRNFDDPGPSLDELQLTLNDPFLMGYWFNIARDSIDPPPEVLPAEGDMFGWARFTYDGDELQIVEQATTTNPNGIYGGTFEIIPEPGTMGLSLMVFLLFPLLKMQRSRA